MNKQVAPELGEALTPRYRTSTAARLAGLAAATLRVWERRYQVVAPFQTDSGHRLYSARQVEHLGVLSRLVRAGHGIGAIASLPGAQLHQMLDAEQRLGGARALLPVPARGTAAEAPGGVTWVLGQGLAQRLTRLAAAAPAGSMAGDGQSGAAALRVLADLDSAAAEVASAPSAGGVLVAHMASLQVETAQRLLALSQRLGVRRLIVLYGFGARQVLALLEAQGAVLLREPASDHALVALLAHGAVSAGPLADPAAIQPRRYDDVALAWFAATSPQLACECPRHLADLLAQLCAFETYSSECASRSPADQALHAQLHVTAARARTLFEAALDAVAQAEGLACPGPMAAP